MARPAGLAAAGAAAVAALVVGGVAAAASGVQSVPFDFARRHVDLLLAFSAYCGPHVNSAFDCYWCKQLPSSTRLAFAGDFGETSGAGAAFGFVGCLDVNGTRSVEVSWRGTDSLAGWIVDAEFRQVAYNGSSTQRVHEGFMNTEASWSADVLKLVEAARATCGGTKDVVVTGHSLGASLALLNGLRLQSLGYSVTVVNFGSPRTGNAAFASWADTALASPIIRFTHARDIVPHLPPRNWLDLVSYHHVAREFWQSDITGDYYRCDGSGEDPACADSVLIPSVLDHATYLGTNALDGVLHGCLYTDH